MRPCDRIHRLLERLSRNRVIRLEEADGVAWRAAVKWSGNPHTSHSAAMPSKRWWYGMYKGRWLFKADERKLDPQLAWKEGRQCIAISRKRCLCGRQIRLSRRDVEGRSMFPETSCTYCRYLRERVWKLQQRFDDIRYLCNKLDRARREVYGSQSRRSSGNLARVD